MCQIAKKKKQKQKKMYDPKLSDCEYSDKIWLDRYFPATELCRNDIQCFSYWTP